MELRLRKSPVDDGTQLRVVDKLLAPVRGERDRGLEQRLPGHDKIAARKLLAHAAQIQSGEDDLRSRGADVDADAEQRNVVLDPQGIVLEAAVRFEVIVVVVEGFLALVAVTVIPAVEMVLQPVGPFRVWILVVHSKGKGLLCATPG